MLKGVLSLAMTVFVVTCVLTLLLLAAVRWFAVARGLIPVRPDLGPGDELGHERFGAVALTNGGTGGDGIQAPDGVQPAGTEPPSGAQGR